MIWRLFRKATEIRESVPPSEVLRALHAIEAAQAAGQPASGDAVALAILAGFLPTEVNASGCITLVRQGSRRMDHLTLPEGLHADELDASCCNTITLPRGMKIGKLRLNKCGNLFDKFNTFPLLHLPSDLVCEELELVDSGVVEIPAGLQVSQRIDLSGCMHLRTLPKGFQTDVLTLRDCTGLTELPEGLNVHSLNISGCTSLSSFPKSGRVRGGQLIARDCINLESLPNWFEELAALDLSGCVKLKMNAPPAFQITSLILQNCTALTELPEGLNVDSLDITGCTSLRSFPARGRIRGGSLIARGCQNLQRLPPWLRELTALDLRGCTSLTEIPEGVQVSSWVDFSGTGITKLPESMRGAGLRWKGIPVNEQVVFRPETLSAGDVLRQRNAEVRRVMLERIGIQRFFELTQGRLLDTDSDKGGVRRLMRVEMRGDEPLVCVSYVCPSTGRQYVTRVPPHVQTCLQAMAWIAGFDDPDLYRPEAET